MTEENQKRRGCLLEIETIVHETLASQPAEDDPVQCGAALDRGMGRIAALCCRYAADRIPKHALQCNVCRKPLSPDNYHRVWFGPPDAAPANVVLCTGCYDSVFSSLRKVPSCACSGGPT